MAKQSEFISSKIVKNKASIYIRMKKILFPTDFSENALHGIKYGIQLLKGVPCEFYLLHAFMATEAVGVLISVLDILEQEASDALNAEIEMIKALFPNEELVIKPMVEPGTLGEAIKGVVDSEEMDLVIMGTEGATGIQEAFWGSNTSRVIREIKCPVLAIPNDFPFHKPKEILVALDNTVEKKMNGQFGPLYDLVEKFNPQITFLNVLKPEEVYESADANPIWLKNYKNASKEIEYGDDVAKVIEKYLDRWSTDMLVMIAHHYSFIDKILHRSVTKKMVTETSVPLLVLHD